MRSTKADPIWIKLLTFEGAVKTVGLNAAGPVFGPPGVEINLLYIAGLVSLMLTGAGALSVDAMRRKSAGG